MENALTPSLLLLLCGYLWLMKHFIFNGKLYKENTAIISTGNRGLRYGDGLFETMKMLNGKIVLADAHFARLWKGMGVLGFDMPKLFTPEKILEEILLLAKKNSHHQQARIRLQVIRGDGGLYDAANHLPNYIIETWELPDGNGGLNTNGLVVGIYTDAKKSCDVLSNIKHNNYLPYAMAALHAKKEKWNDALLLNSAERICDSTIANMFIIKKDAVFTPALTEGCVAGVIREHIIHTLKTSAWQVTEAALTIDDVLQADEVFLTNSMYNMRWVKSLAGASYSNVATAKIYQAVLPTIQ